MAGALLLDGAFCQGDLNSSLDAGSRVIVEPLHLSPEFCKSEIAHPGSIPGVTGPQV